MNRLKKEMRERQIEFLMTYADNLAIQYFKKQGFSEMIQVPPEIWKGYLKDYDGSTHMECLIYPNIDYSEISSYIVGQMLSQDWWQMTRYTTDCRLRSTTSRRRTLSWMMMHSWTRSCRSLE